MEEDLKKLGLTDNEIKIYLSLIRVGETPVGGIINDLKIHRQIAYNALDALEKKNMVSKTMRNKINYYKINDPEIIVENIKKQELVAQRVSQKIKKDLGKSKMEQEINIYCGSAQIGKYYIDKYKSLPDHYELLGLFTTGKKFVETMTDKYLKESEKIRAKKKITIRHVVGQPYYEEMINLAKSLTPGLRKVKRLPFDINNPVSTIIFQDGINFNLFFPNQPFLIDIKNQDFANSMKQYFEELWKIAKN